MAELEAIGEVLVKKLTNKIIMKKLYVNKEQLEYNIKSSVYDRGTYKDIVVCSKNYLQIIFDNFYKNSHYFIKRKYNVWCPSFEKSNEQNSVNSVKGERTHQTEPSHNLKGAETLN